MDPLSEDPAHRLAIYGTLAPGRPNAHQLAELSGGWTMGTIRGHLHERGWGAADGYPGIVLDPTGGAVRVLVFTSADLPHHWDRLDAFEGAGYRRTPVTVATAGGHVSAYVYELEPDQA